MMKKIMLSAASLAMVLAGCGLQTETDLPSNKQDTLERQVGPETPFLPDIRAIWEQSDDTRTILGDDGVHVLWEPSDELYVALRASSSLCCVRYKSKIPEPSPYAVFSPDYSTFEPGANIIGASPCHILSAFYPMPSNDPRNTVFLEGYYYDNSLSSYSVKFKLLACQQGKEESFRSEYMPAWSLADADDPNGTFNFYFICGGVRFSVAQEGIKAVVFKSRDGKALAGSEIMAKLGENKRPEIQTVAFGIDSVKVTAPHDAFIPGKHYFAVMLPQELEKGLSVSFLKDHQSATVEIDKSITVRRARFGILNELDKNLVFEEISPSPVPDGIIPFKDPSAKRLLLKYFDTDGDDELSYLEAAAVTSLDFLKPQESMLSNFRSIHSFDELQYFTGITEIPDRMFAGCPDLTSICFPPQLKTIRGFAFHNCKRLCNVLFSGRLTTAIEYGAFMGCESLTAIQLPTSLKDIEQYVFSDCSALETVQLPEGIQSIGFKAFYKCSALKHVSFPPSLQRIEPNAFYLCSALKQVSFPSSLQCIGGQAFFFCESLTDIEIPENVADLQPDAFTGCTHLQTLKIGKCIETGPLRDIGFIKSRFGSSPLTHIILSEKVTQIPDLTFADCPRLQSVQLPDRLKAMGESAFARSGITSIVIPQGITEIPYCCFLNCSSLQTVSLPDGIHAFGESAFAGSGITTFQFPQTITAIPDLCFSGCPSLSSVVIPESVTEIGRRAFYMCRMLRSAELPEHLSVLGSNAFSWCLRLTSAILKSPVPPENRIDSDAGDTGERFDNTSCTVYVPDASVDTYKADPYFADFASRIRPLSEYTGN